MAERAALTHDGNPHLGKWDVLGLRQIIPTYFLPTSLLGWHLSLAIRPHTLRQKVTLRLIEENGDEVGRFDITPPQNELEDAARRTRAKSFAANSNLGAWVPFFFRVDFPITIKSAGQYLLVLHRDDGTDDTIGAVLVVIVDPIPLTAERIAALKSAPRAVNAVRVILSCKKCQDELRVYAAFEKNKKAEDEGFRWYESLPDEFICGCKETIFPLETIRRNFYALLGESMSRLEGTTSMIPLYEESGLRAISRQFQELISSASREEEIQVFIQENPIVLHQFPSIKLFFKPAILSQFKADFAVVTPQRELILIEIERTATRLLNKNGGRASELGVAFDQVRSWLHLIEDHRLAVLDDLGIDRDMVSTVRGVVIAGRDGAYHPKHLRLLKAGDGGKISFLTYDDLAKGMISLVDQVQRL